VRSRPLDTRQPPGIPGESPLQRAGGGGGTGGQPRAANRREENLVTASNDNRYWLQQCRWSYRYHSVGDSMEGRGRQPRQTLLWCPYQAIQSSIRRSANLLILDSPGPERPQARPKLARYGDLLLESIYNLPCVPSLSTPPSLPAACAGIAQ
jgi:hypothetical protein